MEDNKVIVLMRGVPGCGKSTEVEKNYVPNNFQVVSRDEFRQVLGTNPHATNGELNQAQEDIIKTVTNLVLTAHLQAGRNIVVDETHIYVKTIAHTIRLARKYGYYTIVHEILTDFEECKKRRPGFPADVHHRMMLDKIAQDTFLGDCGFHKYVTDFEKVRELLS